MGRKTSKKAKKRLLSRGQAKAVRNLVGLVGKLRLIAKTYPSTKKTVRKINNRLLHVATDILQHQETLPKD